MPVIVDKRNLVFCCLLWPVSAYVQFVAWQSLLWSPQQSNISEINVDIKVIQRKCWCCEYIYIYTNSIGTNEGFYHLLVLKIDTTTNNFDTWCWEQIKTGGTKKILIETIFRWRSTLLLRFILKAIVSLLLVPYSGSVDLTR